ncbi:hypothetical protein VKT23_003514 [Stygiomarasmius scandens]|uniref:Methyltransferase domain-containing protein n=1 Tax=Marasmiellus scandens TaxID=2682957 RepID=A0ABR1JY65_9AGAR
MSSESNTLYGAIEKDQEERKRLDEGYLFLKKYIRNDRVIYDEAAILPDDAAVLDVATGAGSWILDLAQIVPPSVSIYGVDISTTYFPAIRSSKYQNITLSVHSCTSLPEEWTNKFDLVNQSLLIACLTGNDWIADIRELYRVAKPGGYVQLFESTNAGWDCPLESANGKARALFTALYGKYSLLIDDVGGKISRVLADTGFVDICQHTGTYPVNSNIDENGKHGADLSVSWMRQLQPSIMRNSGFGIVKSDEDFNNLMEELRQEWDSGVPYKNFVMVWGRKPLQ